MSHPASSSSTPFRDSHLHSPALAPAPGVRLWAVAGAALHHAEHEEPGWHARVDGARSALSCVPPQLCSLAVRCGGASPHRRSPTRLPPAHASAPWLPHGPPSPFLPFSPPRCSRLRARLAPLCCLAQQAAAKHAAPPCPRALHPQRCCAPSRTTKSATSTPTASASGSWPPTRSPGTTCRPCRCGVRCGPLPPRRPPGLHTLGWVPAAPALRPRQRGPACGRCARQEAWQRSCGRWALALAPAAPGPAPRNACPDASPGPSGGGRRGLERHATACPGGRPPGHAPAHRRVLCRARQPAILQV